MNERLRHRVRELVALLTRGNFEDVEAITRGVRLSSQDMARAINDYGRQLVLPPEQAYMLMDVIELRNGEPTRWSVTMPLWTREEGRSDLTLELSVVVGQNGLAIELGGIHVL